MIEGDSVTYVRNCKMKKREKRKLEPRIALINDVSFIAMDIKRASLRTESKRTHTHIYRIIFNEKQPPQQRTLEVQICGRLLISTATV